MSGSAISVSKAMTPSRPGLKSGSLVAVVMGRILSRDRRCCRLGACQSDRVQPPAPGGATPDPAVMRRVYELTGVDIDDLGPDPVVAFGRWFADVAAAGVGEPNAMVLATVGADGTPGGPDRAAQGVRRARPAVLHQPRLGQGRRPGREPARRAGVPVAPGRATGAGDGTGGGAEPRRGRGLLRDAAAGLAARRVGEPAVGGGRLAGRPRRGAGGGRGAVPGEVPAPPGWGGFRVVPEQWEFWAGRSGRLHDRLRYRRTSDGWTIERLAP